MQRQLRSIDTWINKYYSTENYENHKLLVFMIELYLIYI